MLDFGWTYIVLGFGWTDTQREVCVRFWVD